VPDLLGIVTRFFGTNWFRTVLWTREVANLCELRGEVLIRDHIQNGDTIWMSVEGASSAGEGDEDSIDGVSPYNHLQSPVEVFSGDDYFHTAADSHASTTQDVAIRTPEEPYQGLTEEPRDEDIMEPQSIAGLFVTQDLFQGMLVFLFFY
jgi:hypothetical protein